MLSKREAQRYFIIRYKFDSKGYYIKDLGEGSGTFVRVDRPLVSNFTTINYFQILSSGFLISFGETQMVV